MLLSNFNTGFENTTNAATRMDGTVTSYISLNQLSSYNSNGHYGATGTSCYCIVIGAGDTPVTKEDYDLADASIMANDKMKSMTQNATYSKVSGAAITCQWLNNSSDPITIKEIGLSFKTGGGAYNKSGNILVARKVLTTPLTVQPGETYAFTYNIKV